MNKFVTVSESRTVTAHGIFNNNMIEFVESQKDSKGREIRNEIGRYQSFRAPVDKKSADDYKREGKIVFVDENGAIVGNVFREK